MEDALIKFKTGELAKKKGFDVELNMYYFIHNNNSEPSPILNGKMSDLKSDWNQHYNTVSAPTQSLLQKWLREYHKIYVRVDTVEDKRHYSWVKQYDKDIVLNLETKETYEEALEIGLYKALELINLN